MKCPECEKLEFIISEQKIMIDELEKEIKRLKKIIEEKGV